MIDNLTTPGKRKSKFHSNSSISIILRSVWVSGVSRIPIPFFPTDPFHPSHSKKINVKAFKQISLAYAHSYNKVLVKVSEKIRGLASGKALARFRCGYTTNHYNPKWNLNKVKVKSKRWEVERNLFRKKGALSMICGPLGCFISFWVNRARPQISRKMSKAVHFDHQCTPIACSTCNPDSL